MAQDATSVEIAGERIGAPGTEIHEKIRRGVGQISAELIEDRRRFHALAELGWRERRTTAEIVDRLAALGFAVSSGKEFLKDAPLLLLDEATSALDAKSEETIREALARLMRGWTVIAIAHRISTVRQFDRILVIGGGRLLQDGSSEELARRSGLYRELLRA